MTQAKGHRDGLSPETAVIVEARDRWEGAFAEIQFLQTKLGVRGVDWNKLGQWLINHQGTPMDQIQVELKNGNKLDFYFDISLFFGQE